MSIVPDRYETPFVGICATGYYDGPLSGWALGRAGTVYTFEMIDSDEGQDVRVFAIYAVPVVVQRDVLRFGGWQSATGFAIVSPRDAELLPSLAVPPDETRVIAVVAATAMLTGLVAWTPCRAPLEQDRDWLRTFGIPSAGSW